MVYALSLAQRGGAISVISSHFDSWTNPLLFRHSLLTISQEREASLHSIIVNSFTLVNGGAEDEETVSHVYFSLNSCHTR